MYSAEHIALIVVEAIACAGFLLILPLAGLLFFNRRSYKVLLLLWAQCSCLVPKSLSEKQSTRKTLRDVADKAAVDLLVCGLLLFTLFRVASQLFRTICFATRASDHEERFVEQLATALFIFGFAFYNALFVLLAWMWLKVALVLFSDKSKKCVSWTLGFLLSACMVLIVATIVTAAILNLIPQLKFGNLRNVYTILIAILAPIFGLSQLMLTVIIIGLAIKICLLMKIPSAASTVRNKEEEKKLRVVIGKVSIGMLFFVLALIVREIGLGVVLLRNAFPGWGVVVCFITIVPEYIGCLTVIYVLWPYNCNICSKAGKKQASANATAEVELGSKTPRLVTSSPSPCTPTESSPVVECSLIPESQNQEESQVVESPIVVT